MADIYGGWIRFEQILNAAGQYFVTCKCGWREQTAGGKTIAGQTARHHVGGEHGVTIPEPPSRPQRIHATAAGTAARTSIHGQVAAAYAQIAPRR